MSYVRDGIAASPGIVIGPAYVLQWEVPRAPHTTVAPEQIEEEVARLREALEYAKARIREIQAATAERLGPVEAQIFEPQVLMLEDSDLVDGAIEYIRENHLGAARAFELRMLEFQSALTRAGHPMGLDRLNDMLDVQVRVVRRLLGLPDPAIAPADGDQKVVLFARDLTPTITVQLDRGAVLGIATDAGTRTSHSAILARSLGLPAVVSLGDLSERITTGQEVILDGRGGRVIVEPEEREKRLYRERDITVREWEQELLLLAHLDAVTADHEAVVLRANIDMPLEAQTARDHGAVGVGLFRTEFLVVGRNTMPGEEEQYRAYRQVAEAFPEGAVIIRSYDLGGDKFPLFLHMPPEENPFLGWRAIRVCLDTPELFRTQLRAMLRATVHGDVRIMLPLVNEVDEILRTRALLDEEAQKLRADGIDVAPDYKLGIMIETPAAAMSARELARHVDFLSIGTNDLVQYSLAVDRGNARLAPLYNPFHPGVVRMIREVVEAGREAGIEVGVCGELAANPLGAFMLLGLGIRHLSVGAASLLEIKKVIRSIPAASAEEAVVEVARAERSQDVVRALSRGMSRWLDLSLFAGRWNLSEAQ